MSDLPEISLLEPTVIRSVVQKLAVRDSLILLSAAGAPRAWPFPTVNWDVVRASRSVARPNVPNSEAHIVGRLGRSAETANFVYLREKKVFSPTSLYWIRTPGQLAKVNAEAEVMREVEDLNARFDNFVELLMWRAYSGHISLRYADTIAEVDYGFPASHRVTVAEGWGLDTTTPVDIVQDVRCLKRLVARNAQVQAKQVYGTEATLSMIFDKWAVTSNVVANFNGAYLMSDRMKDEWFRSGVLAGFMGLNWTMVESYYEDDDTAYDPGSPADTAINFIPDGVLFLGNYTDNNPIELVTGPSADLDAPQGFTGKFSKTWQDPDPSGKQYLLEWNIFPIITRPEQFVVACVGTPAQCDLLPSSCSLPGGANAGAAFPGSKP